MLTSMPRAWLRLRQQRVGLRKPSFGRQCPTRCDRAERADASHDAVPGAPLRRRTIGAGSFDERLALFDVGAARMRAVTQCQVIVLPSLGGGSPSNNRW